MTLLKDTVLVFALASNSLVLLYFLYTSFVAPLPVNNFFLGAWLAVINPTTTLTYLLTDLYGK